MTKIKLEPTIFVIFGGGGDLAWRKLLPSLYNLSQDAQLPEKFSILLVDRSDLGDAKEKKHLHEGINQFARCKATTAQWNQFEKHFHYLKGDFNDSKAYSAIAQQCSKIEKEWDEKAQRIFYMATLPSLFGTIATHLHEAGLSKDKKNSRIVVEKPIGYDLKSAQELDHIIGKNFDESQIFRIDHYLGKETVQNILAFRFANPLFEPIWNRRYVDFVAITVAEQVGIEHRGGYYDHAGALRDMVQNHLLQLLSLVAMEPLNSFDANEINNKKLDILHAIRPISPETVHGCVVRGQYNKGWIECEKVCGYREEEGVSPVSLTETFVALKLSVDNWRWQGVPFYLRTGKRLAKHTSEIVIQFRAVPHQAFPPEATLEWQPASLIISIQPIEGITLRFQAKYPGPMMHLRKVDMNFNYQEAFDVKSHDAYETLLWDVMKNDQTLFKRVDLVDASWKMFMPILEMWELSPPSDFPNYEAGSWGPEASDWLLAQQGHCWPKVNEQA